MFTYTVCFILFATAHGKIDNLTDLKKCKLSHLGLEYYGDSSRTDSGALCQHWNSANPVHKIDPSYTDRKFSDFSIGKAKNYCRNPNKDRRGPWCYTMDPQLIDETCAIPLCRYLECKITGPGMEYAGNHSLTNCKSWDKKFRRVKSGKNVIEADRFGKTLFPDEDVGSAKKYCRNPDGDPGGPWCYVNSDESDLVQKEYCNIPFCDDQDCMFFTKNSSLYSHYTNLNGTLTNLSFAVKLWDSDSFLDGEARLLLTVVSLPLTPGEIDEMRIGIEIFISNRGSALTINNKEVIELEDSFGVLKSTKYSHLSLNWDRNFIALNLEGQKTPIFLAEYKTENSLLSLRKDSFLFYSVKGTNVLWNFPFCDDNICEVHTTTSFEFIRYFPMHQTSTGHDVHFFVRAYRSCFVNLTPTPAVSYPKISISFAVNNITEITLTEGKGEPRILLRDTQIPNLLSYWSWNEFTVTVFGDSLQILWFRHSTSQIILEAEHHSIHSMRWFSIASDDTVAHWTLLCRPSQADAVPPAWPPECTLDQTETNYKGTQWVTSEGYPCVPWSRTKELKFDNETALEATNYCRNPSKTPEGAYCYAIKQKEKTKVSKSRCGLRKCRSSECRLAGTGNDYVGKLNRTRSNRTCRNWIGNGTHEVPGEYLNASLYGDLQLNDTANYCRDPSRNIAGPWCYTVDPEVGFDLCDVRDCVKTEECTVLTRGNGLDRLVYILPQWKETELEGGLHFSLKEWNPDLLDGIIFLIYPFEGENVYQISIGANNNEKVILEYGLSVEKTKTVKEKTIPHIIPAGKWGGLWLQIAKGVIRIGYESVFEPFFEWTHDDVSKAMEPGFLSYMSLEGNTIGVNFKCTECHVEKTTTKHITRVMPIGLWSETESHRYNRLVLYLRGTGIALVPLILLPGSGDYFALTIGDASQYMFFVKNAPGVAKTLTYAGIPQPMLTNDSWTVFNITYNETNIRVERNRTVVLTYRSPVPLLFYWFSVGAEKGWITWAANCVPPDIDGAPLDGDWSEWSPWQCSVDCGGGKGFRTRTCTNPRPNIYGRLCDGPAQESGVCNDFECGDVSPETLDEIRNRLKKTPVGFVVNEGDPVTIKNDDEILEQIDFETPELRYEWSLNGVVYEPDEERTNFVEDDIGIVAAHSVDAGVYTCTLHRPHGEQTVMRVVSLAVISKNYDVVTRATYKYRLRCKSVMLGYVYSDLRQKWSLNDKSVFDYGTTTLAAVDSEYIESLNKSHTGTWKCVVEQHDLNLQWTTNIVKILVKRKPNILSHLMEDELTSTIFAPLKTETNVFVVLVTIVAAVISIVAFALYAYFRWCTLPSTVPYSRRRKYKRRRQLL